MLPCLIDERSRQQLAGIELGDRKPFEPRLMSARQAMQLRTIRVPGAEIDAIGAAEAEQQRGHAVG